MGLVTRMKHQMRHVGYFLRLTLSVNRASLANYFRPSRRKIKYSCFTFRSNPLRTRRTLRRRPVTVLIVLIVIAQRRVWLWRSQEAAPAKRVAARVLSRSDVSEFRRRAVCTLKATARERDVRDATRCRNKARKVELVEAATPRPRHLFTPTIVASFSVVYLR